MTDKTANTMPESKKVKPIKRAQSREMLVNEVPEDAKRISSAVDEAISTAFKENKSEFTIPEVVEKADTISSVAMAKEIGNWIVGNVEQFIDNQDTVFRMYLNISSDMGMPMSSLYQRLYLSVYNAEEAVVTDETDKALNKLNAMLEETKSNMEKDAEFLSALFKKMAFFYELTGFVVKDGKVQQALTQKMDGKVSINVLEFDPVSLTTTVAQGVGQNKDGVIREGDEKVIVKQEEMPAGFGIEIEISMSPKNNVPSSMY